MSKNFNNTLTLAKMGEQEMIKYLSEYDLTITDVSDDEYYRKKDIDIIVNDGIRDNILADIKTDMRVHETGNLYYEVMNTRNSGDYTGWFVYTESEYIIHYDPFYKFVYIVNLELLKEYIKNNNIPLREHKSSVDKDEYCKMYLVNADKLIKADIACKYAVIDPIYAYEEFKEAEARYKNQVQ